jgi:hypothetical protein
MSDSIDDLLAKMPPRRILARRAFQGLFGAIIGAPVGMAIGFYFVLYGSSWLDPLIPGLEQLGWIGLFVAVPTGGFFGVMSGGVLAALRFRLFAVTFLPLFLALLIWHLILHRLRNDHQPRTYIVRVSGKAGEKFVGEVEADGQPQRVKGTFPAEFEFEAIRLRSEFTMLNSKKGDKISVDVIVNGVSRGPFDSDVGVRSEFKSFGYDERFGGTSSNQGIMDPEHARHLQDRAGL